MKAVSISGSLRENVGKKDAKTLRKQGFIPCVLYGGKEQKKLKIEERSLIKLINTPEVFTVKLDIDGKIHDCIFKEIQFHPVTDRVIHVDFLEVFPDKPVVIGIPIKVHGTSPGILAGGKLINKLRKLNVKGLYTDLPGYVDIDISTVELGDSIKVRDMNLEGLEFTDNPGSVIVMVKLTRGAMSASDIEEEEAKEAEAEAESAGESKEGDDDKEDKS